MQAWAWVLVGMGFVDRYGSIFLLPPRHFYILPTDNKKIAIGGGFWGAIGGGINCGRVFRAPTNPLWELGLGDIWAIDRPISGRGALSAPAISKQGFRSIYPKANFCKSFTKA
jgi:hypothetical protein